jgi:serine/threonine protein kinase
VARISLHALREERVFHICKTLAAEDPSGYHIVRPIEMVRLASQHGDNGPISVCIFESAGPNYLSKVIDFGPFYYDIQLRGNDFHGIRNINFVPEPISLQTFLDFAIGAAECIEILHGQQIVHGEVRGDAFHFNIETGRTRLVNLGAGVRTFEQGLTSLGWSTMSRELGVKTKLSFMSPEQTGRMPIEPDTRTDIFSLGILFWSILLQKPAFEGETPMDIIQAVLGKRLPLVSNVRLDIPAVVGRIIQRATAKNVADRYHSVSGMRNDFVEVRKLLGTGDSAKLQDLKIATKDVSPSFILPELMVGRTSDHDTIVKVIDHAFKLRQDGQRPEKHGLNHLSRLSEGHFSSFDTALTTGDPSAENDKSSSVDGRTNSLSLSDAASGDPRSFKLSTSRLRSPAESRHNSIDSASGPQDFELKTPEKRGSATLESTSAVASAVDSMNGDVGRPTSSSDGMGNLNIRRNIGSVRVKGRCEVITIAGAAGLGKSRLLSSIQIESRQRGYFASSKFDQAEKKVPFSAILKVLSSLFQQVFSESHIDPIFHQILKQHVAPVWPTLHKVLNLPEHLLGPKLPVRVVSQSSKRGYNKSLGADAGIRESSPSNFHNSTYGKSFGAQSSQDFLRAGSSTKSLPLMNTILEILRLFTRYKFICLCLDDLRFADEESLELISQCISTRIKMVIVLAYRPEEVSSDTLRTILDISESEGNLFTLIHVPLQANNSQITAKMEIWESHLFLLSP